MIRSFDFKDFSMDFNVRSMKISAAPEGMPRALASVFKSFLRSFSLYSIFCKLRKDN